MHAAVIHALGQPPRYESFAEPEPQEGDAMVHVRAAGLHPIVRALASGSHYAGGSTLPMIPGIDGAGTLEDGRRVYFGLMRQPWGTMAELCAAPRSMFVSLPDNLDFATAAAIANPGMSAWVSIKERAALRPGETILIMGATGVAGQLAVQVARQAGAKRVIAAGRNVEALGDLSVDAVVPLGDSEEAIREAFTREALSGIDVVIDYLWGRPTELLLDSLAKGFNAAATHRTRLVEVGTSAAPTITLPGALLRSIDLTLVGSGFGAASIDRILAAIPELFELAAKGNLRIDVEAVPLRDVEAAWTRKASGRRVVFTL